MKPVVAHVDARAELDAGRDLSEHPARFEADVRGAVESIRSGLLVAALYGRTCCRIYPMTRLPYSLVYEDRADAIFLVAFAHHRRRPGYWIGRLRGRP